MDEVNLLIGPAEEFVEDYSEKSLTDQLKEAREELELLDVEKNKIMLKKIKYVIDETDREIIDRKMNYFNHTQKETMKKFFNDFTEVLDLDEKYDGKLPL